MSDRPRRPDHDESTGEPIHELADLREPTSDRFQERIRGSILRRMFAVDAVDFSLSAVFATFMSYVGMLLQLMPGGTEKRRD